ncbi:type II toxin-antitoxin system VapC family toxin [Henriciella barbarensis]|nr:hypothetical protein [Henriciella barbarensis]
MFYEWLKEEPSSPHRKRALNRILQENEVGHNQIITSTITHLEVLPDKLPLDKERFYFSNFDDEHIIEYNMDPNVVRLAREIRNFYYRPASPGQSFKMMDAGDAIHLATAVIAGVDEFHTRDDDSKGSKVPLVSLYQWSGESRLMGQYDLKIVCPEDDQTNLLDVADGQNGKR